MGDDRIDCSRTHCSPACTAEQRCYEELPGRRRAGPAENTDSRQQCTRFRDHWDAKVPMEHRHICHYDRADYEMRGDGRRDNSYRPVPVLTNGLQVNRQAVEAYSPTEDG